MRAKVRIPTDAEEAAIQRGIEQDGDAPELTDAQLAELQPASEALPADVYAELVRRRGPGKRPAKVPVTIKLEPDVLTALRATGPGWQARAGAALAKLVAK